MSITNLICIAVLYKVTYECVSRRVQKIGKRFKYSFDIIMRKIFWFFFNWNSLPFLFILFVIKSSDNPGDSSTGVNKL